MYYCSLQKWTSDNCWQIKPLLHRIQVMIMDLNAMKDYLVSEWE